MPGMPYFSMIGRIAFATLPFRSAALSSSARLLLVRNAALHSVTIIKFVMFGRILRTSQVLVLAVQRKPRRIQMRERFLEFPKFRGRSVYFDTGEISNLERFFQERVYAFEMREQGLGADVAFAAEHFVAVDGEIIEEIPLLACRLGHEIGQRGLELIELSRMNFEVGMQGDEIGNATHSQKRTRPRVNVERAG